MSPQIPEFLQYFLFDCLEGNKHYSTKRMFSGHGIYYKGKIFAFFSQEKFYFKLTSYNKEDFQKLHLQPFSYTKQGKTATISYYEIPEEILEDREELQIWIENALNY